MSNKETYTVLWETDTPFKNQYSIVLNDSLDNYDEVICYGSANRGGNDRVNVKTTYPVISGTVNLVGPYTLNTWQSTNHYMLNNGTQMYLSGTSGFIDVSYYWGMQNGGTAFEANRYTAARNADVHPYKLVGVKHKHSDKIWETTGNTYETNITLDEPITHFNKLLIYSSGTENSAYGVHLAKNVYTVQPQTVNGCDTWGYSPWALNYRCNYILGCSLKLSGNSGHIGSSYFWGIGQNNATWAAGKWTGTAAPRMLQPYVIYGLDRRPTYKFRSIPTEGGSVSASINPGYEYDIATITAVPKGDDWKCSALNITGAELTGNEFMFGDSDVSAKAEFEHSKDLTLVNSEHGTLSADKMKGFSGDIVTVDAVTDEGWYFTGMNVTGAVATGNKFMFVGEDVTAEGLYTDEGFPIVYENDGHGTLTGDTNIGIPGQPINLTTAYNTYYRFSGYEVTGGYIEDGKLYATAQCTARAVYKPNAFTASGGFDKGSDLSLSEAGSVKYKQTNYLYATASYKTSNVPAAWYSTSNRWKVTSEVSGYKITMNPRMTFYGRTQSNSNQLAGYATGLALIGNTQTQSQSYSTNSQSQQTWNYNKSFTSNTTGVNYGCSGRIGAKGTAGYYYGYANYKASLTTGTWTATGVLP